MQLKVIEGRARRCDLEGRHPRGDARTIPDIMLLKITAALRAPVGVDYERTVRTGDETGFRRVDIVADGRGHTGGRAITSGVVAPRRPGDHAVTRGWGVGGCHARSRGDDVISFSAEGVSADCEVLRATGRRSQRVDRNAGCLAHTRIAGSDCDWSCGTHRARGQREGSRSGTLQDHHARRNRGCAGVGTQQRY
jgi:hypothetical protein